MECLSTLGRSLQRTLSRVCGILAVFMNIQLNRPVQPLLFVVHTRVNRLLWRLDRLALRWQQGRLPAPRPPVQRASRPKPAAPALRVPGGKAWLMKLAPPTGEMYQHVEALLADPEVAALAAAAPQAGRLLRPLARMFGLELPEYLRLPARPKPQRPKRPRARHPMHGKTMAEVAAWLAPMPPHHPLYFRGRRIPNR